MLAEIWFALFVIIVAGYLILDGFDMGVGMLMIPMGKSDDERRTMLNSIGPIWDGNEVWLVIAGGVLFGVFPLVYASLFSGFYLAFMLVLFVMILRTVAMEFRSKEPSPRWRSFWDMVFALASTGLAFLLGVAFGDVLSGVPLDADGNMSVSLIGLLKPVPLLVGAATIAMFAMHGSLYLVQKTEGDLQARIRRAVPRLIAAFFVLNTIVVVGMLLSRDQITTNYVDNIWPVIFPAAALVAILMAYRFVRQGRELAAFLASAATIALLVISGAAGMFPNLIVSTHRPCLQPHRLQRRRGGQHPRRVPHRRRDRDPVHPGVYRRRVLLLPRQDHGRLARLLRPVGRRGPRRGCSRSTPSRAGRSSPGSRSRSGRRSCPSRSPPCWRSPSRASPASRARRPRRPRRRPRCSPRWWRSCSSGPRWAPPVKRLPGGRRCA